MKAPAHSGTTVKNDTQLFSGNIIIFQAFDIGDDINIEKISSTKSLITLDSILPKYFRKYHVPVTVTFPENSESSRCTGCKLYRFGAMSLTYKIPFHNESLENIRKDLDHLYTTSREQSIHDAQKIFGRIQPHIYKPRFFHTNATYIVIQVDQKDSMDATVLQQDFGGIITSMLRFETQVLSEEQKNDILSSAIGYFRGDLVIVDADVSFIYDTDYEEIMDLFEFANIQQLELHYFDRVLDQKLNYIYENPPTSLKIRNYLPFISSLESDPINVLSKLQVDISVIIERLESSVMLSGEPYFAELYELLVNRLELKSWRASVERKLSIIKDVQSNYQSHVDANREDLLTILIIILIFIELIIGILNYFKI